MKKLIVLIGALVLGGCQLLGGEPSPQTATQATTQTTQTTVQLVPRSYRLMQDGQEVKLTLHPKEGNLVEKLAMLFVVPFDETTSNQNKEEIVELLNQNFKTASTPEFKALQKLADVDGVDVLFAVEQEKVVLKIDMLLDKIDSKQLVEATEQGEGVSVFVELAAKYGTMDQWEKGLLEQGAVKE